LLYLSVLTLGEIRKGVWSAAEQTADPLGNLADLELQARFSGRILPIDAAVCRPLGQLAAEAKRKGRSLSAIDGLLAATALHHNITIVSRNVAGFANTPAQILNPWEAD